MSPTAPPHEPQYDDDARARWAAEADKAPYRTPFVPTAPASCTAPPAPARRQDPGGRPSGRRLRPQPADAHPRGRAGRQRHLARRLGCDPDLVETAALAHDLGHPPFGHPGSARSTSSCDAAGGFEGNAQTLRILTRLESKAVDADGHGVGLNLTRAVLGCEHQVPLVTRRRPAAHGAHTGTARLAPSGSSVSTPTTSRSSCGPGQAPTSGRRCLEAQVMDLSDDVAYSVHDIEDGVVAGRIDLAWLSDAGLQREVWETVRAWYLPEAGDDLLAAALERMLARKAGPTRRTTGAGHSRRAEEPHLAVDRAVLLGRDPGHRGGVRAGSARPLRRGPGRPRGDLVGDRRAQGHRRPPRHAGRGQGRAARRAAAGHRRGGRRAPRPSAARARAAVRGRLGRSRRRRRPVGSSSTRSPASPTPRSWRGAGPWSDRCGALHTPRGRPGTWVDGHRLRAWQA